jgi:hypothetical protein
MIARKSLNYEEGQWPLALEREYIQIQKFSCELERRDARLLTLHLRTRQNTQLSLTSAVQG